MKLILYTIAGIFLLIVILTFKLPKLNKYIMHLPSILFILLGGYFVYSHFYYIASGAYEECIANPECMNEAPTLVFGIAFILLGFITSIIILLAKSFARETY